jgi:hypothetical protein
MTTSDRSTAIGLVRTMLSTASKTQRTSLTKRLDAVELVNSARAIQEVDPSQRLGEFNGVLSRATSISPQHCNDVFSELMRSLSSFSGQNQATALRKYLDAVGTMPGDARLAAMSALANGVGQLNGQALAELDAESKKAEIESVQIRANVDTMFDNSIKAVSDIPTTALAPELACQAVAPLVEAMPHMNPAQQQRTIGLAKRVLDDPRVKVLDKAGLVDQIAGSLSQISDLDSGTVDAFAGLIPSLPDVDVAQREGGMTESAKLRAFLHMAVTLRQPLPVLMPHLQKLSPIDQGKAYMLYQATMKA